MIYLLDTCVVSDFIKGDLPTMNHIKTKSPDTIRISSITMMELSYGLELNPARAKKIQPILHDFLKVIAMLPFERKDAVCAGKIRSFLKRQGKPVGYYDVLLAGTALHRDMILVSSNLREFERIEGLRLENWRL